MEVKPGYKQTEMGVIPKDWEVQRIGEIADVGRGRVISHREIAASLHSLYPVYSSQTSNAGVMGYIDTYDFEGEYITWTTDGVNAGTVFYRNGCFNCTNVCGTIKLRKHDAFFVSKVLSTIAPQYVSRNLANPKLMNDVVKQIPVPLPPTLEEQRAIAAVLSDVDALITALDRLIAKKRAIKQGVMQQLLTGKTRLPGFSGAWEVKKLGAILKLRYGKSQREIAVHGGAFPILATSGEVGRTNDYLYDKPSVVIGRKGTIDVPQYVDTPFWAIDTAYYSEISELAIPKFLFYVFNTVAWYSYNEASGVPSLSATTVENIEIPLPSLPEQRAIATVLSDMDAEIAALEARRDKTRALKQGMMQELLTGRIRLVG